MTTPQRWQEIDRIFAAALEHEPAERAVFLDEACGSDEQLRKEVESLLAHDLAESLVGGPAVEEAGRLLARGEARALTGDRIGPYLISGSIGAGGMGEVYLAKDKLGRMVALKLLNRRSEQDKSGIARFQQEARTLLALNHPHIVTIYDIDQDDDVYYIASELVEGETLRQRLDKQEMEIQACLEIAIQVATALAAAHEKAIAHRDIKPENIMIRHDGYVKVLDFGIAKLTEVPTATDLEGPTIRQVQTAEGTVIGTAAYMSPEQARGLPVDTRTDIWSLGVVLYEAISGRKPFSGDTTQDVIGSVLQKEPPPLARYTHGIPDGLEWIVSRALRKERGDRYQTANELLTDLKDLRKKIEFTRSMSSEASGGDPLPLGPAPTSDFRTTAQAIPSSIPSSAEYIVTGIKRHRLALVLCLLVAAAGIVGLGAYLHARNNVAAIQSIAVMPFVNASGNADLEYLSDGITDSLINSLSQLPHLSVKARSSVFRYKGKEVEPQRIASELSVQAILNGRVVQRGDDLTLYLSLVDARNGDQLWGEQYNRKFSDLVPLQSEIARDVSQKLRTRLSGAEEQKVTKNYTANGEAYQLYLKGNYEWNKHTQEDLQKGIEYYNQALEKDPNYALAFTGLADSYAVLGNNYLPPNEAFPKARAYAAKALEIDDTLGGAHGSMAVVRLLYDWNWAETEKELKRALTLDPNNAGAHDMNGAYLGAMGRPDEARAETKRAQALDPLSLQMNTAFGEDTYYARQYTEAIAQLEKTTSLEPHYYRAYLWLGKAYEQNKLYREAIETFQKGMTQAERHPQLLASLGHVYALSGERDKANKVLDELREMSKQRYVSPYLIAVVYVGLGDKDQAFAWLDKAYQDRTFLLIWLKVEPLFDSLRDDPRFADLQRRVGLPQ